MLELILRFMSESHGLAEAPLPVMHLLYWDDLGSATLHWGPAPVALTLLGHLEALGPYWCICHGDFIDSVRYVYLRNRHDEVMHLSRLLSHHLLIFFGLLYHWIKFNLLIKFEFILAVLNQSTDISVVVSGSDCFHLARFQLTLWFDYFWSTRSILSGSHV